MSKYGPLTRILAALKRCLNDTVSEDRALNKKKSKIALYRMTRIYMRAMMGKGKVSCPLPVSVRVVMGNQG